VKKRSLVAAALAFVFVLALATPVFAMTHSASYEWDGTVTMERQVGHLCNTGAEQKVAIYGDGKMERESDATMSKGVLTVEESNDFVTAEDATNNLTVTSVITLCAPAKHEKTATGQVYGEDGWQTYSSETYVPTVAYAYPFTDDPCYYSWVVDNLKAEGEYDALSAFIAEFDAGDSMNEMTNFLQDEFGTDSDIFADKTEQFYRQTYDALTKQIWAVQVEANPGMSGNLHQDFEAAHGPYGSEFDDSFWFIDDEDVVDGYAVSRGEDYVGSYFNIDQHARTSDGILRRFIDISSPFSHAYLMEDFEVEGQVDVEEAFTMTNIAPGVEMEVLWYDLF